MFSSLIEENHPTSIPSRFHISKGFIDLIQCVGLCDQFIEFEFSSAIEIEKA